MALAISLLLFSTLTSVGLVALSAAAARGPWWVRAAAPVVLLAPLLIVSAYAPLVALLIEAATIAVDVAWWRRWRTRRAAGSGWASFSIASLLAVTTIAGVALTLVIRRDDLNDGWQSVAAIGLAGGSAVLLGAWAATQRGVRALAAGATAVGLSGALGAGLMRVDWFVPSLSYRSIGWPPDAYRFADGYFLSPTPDLRHWIWHIVLPATALATQTLVRWGRAARSARKAAVDGARRSQVLTAALATLATVVALPAAWTLLLMTLPTPFPEVQLPQPNGYDVLMAAGRAACDVRISGANGLNFLNCDPYYLTHEQLTTSLAEIALHLERTHAALDQPCLMPVSAIDAPSDDDDYFGNVHCLNQAMVAEAQLAKHDGQRERTLDIYLDVIRLGFQCRRGGLLNHAQAGVTTTRRGVFGIMWMRDELTAEQCRKLIPRIEELKADAEPYAAFARRDYLWQLRSDEWHKRLVAILSYSVANERIESMRHGLALEQANLGLMQAELCLKAYVAEHGGLPGTWGDVEKAGLPALPSDPCDPQGGRLRYVRKGTDHVLYSVGFDGVDHGGVRRDPGSFYNPKYDGDLHVDTFGR